MVPDLTLASIAGTVLTEGIRFLYSQAGELIKWWHARKQQQESVDVAAPVVQAPPNSFDGPVLQGEPDLDELARLEAKLVTSLEDPLLVRIGVLSRAADAENSDQLQAADGLRRLLESVYGQAITFRGELGRPPSGSPVVRGVARADEVAGLQVGVDAESISGGTVEGSSEARVVEPGGQNIGVRAKDIR